MSRGLKSAARNRKTGIALAAGSLCTSLSGRRLPEREIDTAVCGSNYRVTPFGYPGFPASDTDKDGNVDLAEYERLEGCLGGPIGRGCRTVDCDGNWRIDLRYVETLFMEFAEP